MNISIPGQPLAKARARVCRVRGKSMTFDPQNTEKIAMQWKLKAAIGAIHRISGAIEIQLDFYFLPCESDKERNLKLQGLEHHTQKPDLDNLEKFILDCANGILFNDDSQIVCIKSSKQWSENPRTEINIMQKEIIDLEKVDKQIINLFSPSELEELFHDAKILFILAENARSNSSDTKIQWVRQSASNISMFARKYATKLAKINSIHKKHILTEVVEETKNGTLA